MVCFSSGRHLIPIRVEHSPRVCLPEGLVEIASSVLDRAGLLHRRSEVRTAGLVLRRTEEESPDV
eukprot:2838111-Rhodomonas_salina.1